MSVYSDIACGERFGWPDEELEVLRGIAWQEAQEDYDEDEEDEASGTEASAGRTVSGDTIEIILEDAKDNNSSVKRPPVKETRRNSVEDAMKERPHGIDSAFDVVEADEVPKEVADKAKEAVDRKPAVHVKSSEPQKVALPGEDDIEDE